MKLQLNLMLLTIIMVLLSTEFQSISYATVAKTVNTSPGTRHMTNADDTFLTSPDTGIVIFEMDDPQEDWLEDITIQLTEAHISKGVDVVLGVIPYGLNRSWDQSLSKNLMDWYVNHSDVVEIAHHGYNHSALGGKSYEEQRENIQDGLDVFQRYGIRPYTFIPPYSSADNTTARVLEDLEFHTLQDNMDHNLETRILTLIGPGVRLVKDGTVGLHTKIKSVEEIINEIDQVIEERGVAPVFYHMQDLRTEDGAMNYTKYNQFLDILDALKNSGKYRFMTSEEYHWIRQGDINGDGSIDILDVSEVALAFHSSQGDPNWNPLADLDRNRIINILDIAVVAKEFGKCAYTEGDIYAGFTLMPASTEHPPSYWVKAASQISLKVPSSQSIASWAVGIIRSNTKCALYFPKPDDLTINDPYIEFVESIDINEPYLDAFDMADIRMRLTVQPGDADVGNLIDILMFQYGHHRCIHGIGIDVEWFQSSSYTNGKPVSNTEALNWLAKLGTYNPEYKLYLVHWQTNKMPTTHIPGVIYVNDAQNFSGGLAGMMSSFNSWSTAFSDAEVAYAVGYTKDEDWWSTYVDPISTVMNEVATICNCESIYWWAKTIYELIPP